VLGVNALALNPGSGGLAGFALLTEREFALDLALAGCEVDVRHTDRATWFNVPIHYPDLVMLSRAYNPGSSFERLSHNIILPYINYKKPSELFQSYSGQAFRSI
jgi:hypothetical protein